MAEGAAAKLQIITKSAALTLSEVPSSAEQLLHVVPDFVGGQSRPCTLRGFPGQVEPDPLGERQAALDRLLAIAPALEAARAEPMSEDEIAAEVKAARAERRAREQAAKGASAGRS